MFRQVAEEAGAERVAAVFVAAAGCFGDLLAVEVEGESFAGPEVVAAADDDAVALAFLKLTPRKPFV